LLVVKVVLKDGLFVISLWKGVAEI